MVTSSTKALLEDTRVIEANQFPIKSVKLFSSGSAEITRTFPLSFLHSQDEPQVVEIVHLPAGLQSIDVSVTSTSGNVTTLDHYHTSIAKPQPFGNSKPSSQKLRELETERSRLDDERRLRQAELHPEAAQMVSFFDEFIEIGVTRSVVIAELDAKLVDVDNRITEERERLSKLSSNLPAAVVTVLSCNSQVPVEAAELTLTYGKENDYQSVPPEMTAFLVVRQVSWKPAYDLHIAMTGNTPSLTVRLDFRCTVTQWTCENWENVSLVLTTADQVSQLIRLPEPKRIDISLGPIHVVQQPSMAPLPSQPIVIQPSWPSWDRRPGLFGAPSAISEQQLPPPHEPSYAQPTRACVPQINPPLLPPSPVANEAFEVDAPSQTVSQLISHGSKDPITHIANGSIFIPSDHATHHVLVASLSLQAEFMRVVVPSTDTRVYYTCEVKNTSEYVLLPGTVKTYLNDKHVSSTDIQNTELPQILECSLAVDTGVKTIHNRAPDALPSVGAFSGKATTTYTSATVIHNTHAEPIRGVVVRSSIPLPTDPRITIVLKEPAGLADMDEGSVPVREGCLARWSTTGGRKGKQAGLFEWVCDVNPGTEMLRAVWEVCAPQDLKLSEQVRS
ncbi:hypothetical protein J3R83DRAFT_12511 [Lanmaoa asiatica]|nr:hypothetical protein J3R83DRAFT_12511 [Lanmaoa asiatica]